MVSLPLADLINWGWLRIGPPYIYININPIIFQIGPLAVRWYGLMYVVGILVGLQVISGYMARKGISQEVLYRTLWWCIAAGLLGGRLYFVLQQHDLVQDYILQPWRILATWEGGMAFYGAIFLVIVAVYWRAHVEHINPLVCLDAAALFATVGQIFGRIGNLINGDIIGYKSTLPWSTVYVNPNSWACNPYVIAGTCNTPVQPAAGYELLSNLVLLAVMFYLARRLTRPGLLILVYLFSYSIIQFLLFFVRDNTIETPFGLNWGLKQAQWTSLVVFIVLLPVTYWILRTSKSVPAGELAASYGIPLRKKQQQSSAIADESTAEQDQETPHLEHYGIVSPEDTQVLLQPDQLSTTDSEDTQVLLQSDLAVHPDTDQTDVLIVSDPDLAVSSDSSEVDLASYPDPSAVPDTPEVDLTSDPDLSVSSDASEADLTSDPDLAVSSDASEVDLTSDPDLAVSSDASEVDLTSDPDLSVSSDASEADLTSDPDLAVSSDASEVDLTSDPDLSVSSDASEADLTSDPDPSAVSDTSEADLTSDPDLAVSSDSSEVPINSDPDLSVSSDSSEADLTSDPDPSAVSDTSEADLTSDPDLAVSSDSSEVPINSDPDLSVSSDSSEVNFTSDPDPSAVSDTSEADLTSDPDLSVSSDSSEVDLTSDPDLSVSSDSSEADLSVSSDSSEVPINSD